MQTKIESIILPLCTPVVYPHLLSRTIPPPPERTADLARAQGGLPVTDESHGMASRGGMAEPPGPVCLGEMTPGC